MKRTLSLLTAGAALIVSSAAAHANSNPAAAVTAGSAIVSTPSAFTLPLEGFAASDLAVPGGSTAAFGFDAPERPRLESIRYRPRYPHSGESEGPESMRATQFHLGFFDPEGKADNGFVAGVRGGPFIDPHIQLGAGLDWVHRSDNQSFLESSSPGPGGTTITTRREISSSSSNLFPIMGFLQISADQNLSIIPYFGLAGGYEVLLLKADDFITGSSFDATYGGWGWQAWGGGAFPLSGRSRLTGEIFVNQGDAHRDVNDPALGGTVREIVNLNGVGVRFGLNWGF